MVGNRANANSLLEWTVQNFSTCDKAIWQRRIDEIISSFFCLIVEWCVKQNWVVGGGEERLNNHRNSSFFKLPSTLLLSPSFYLRNRHHHEATGERDKGRRGRKRSGDRKQRLCWMFSKSLRELLAEQKTPSHALPSPLHPTPVILCFTLPPLHEIFARLRSRKQGTSSSVSTFLFLEIGTTCGFPNNSKQSRLPKKKERFTHT